MLMRIRWRGYAVIHLIVNSSAKSFLSAPKGTKNGNQDSGSVQLASRHSCAIT